MDQKTHIKIYKENLEIVLEYVEKLLETMPGTTIVTSDHGEAFGERIFPFLPFKLFGHHRRFKIPILMNIPWLVIESPDKDIQISPDFIEKLKIQDKIQKISKDKLLTPKRN
jgi:hypothetical protein